MDAPSCWEIFRDEARRGAIVLVGVVNPVGVELDLAVVEVEDRRVRENAIGVGIIAFARPCHQTSRFTSRKGLYPLDLEFNSAAFAFAKSTLSKGKQYPLNTTLSWKP